MMKSKEERSDLVRHATMDVVMVRVPDVIPIILKYKMHCVGCLLAPFHDVADAAYEHGIDEDLLMREFLNALPKAK